MSALPPGQRMRAWAGGVVRGKAGIRHGFGEIGMVVERGWRGRGVGSALLDAAISLAREQGLQKLSLEVFIRAQHGSDRPVPQVRLCRRAARGDIRVGGHHIQDNEFVQTSIGMQYFGTQVIRGRPAPPIGQVVAGIVPQEPPVSRRGQHAPRAGRTERCRRLVRFGQERLADSEECRGLELGEHCEASPPRGSANQACLR